MEQGLISVVVPAYNVEKLIKKCLSSILNQTYRNFELVIINDGSTDDTLKRIEEMNIQHRRVIITTENFGLSAARNRGISESSGEYITFIDSDDEVDKDYLEYLLNLSQKFNASISSCQHIVEFAHKKNINMSFREKSQFVSSHDWVHGALIMSKFDVSAWGKLYKADLLNEHIFPNGKLFEDTYAIPTLVSGIDGVAVGSEAKYHYEIRKNSITRSEFKKSALDLITNTDAMTEKILGVFPDLEREAETRKAWAGVSTLSSLLRSKEAKYNMKTAYKIRKYILKVAPSVIFYSKSKLELKVALVMIFININLYKYFLKLRDR